MGIMKKLKKKINKIHLLNLDLTLNSYFTFEVIWDLDFLLVLADEPVSLKYKSKL